MKCECSLKEFCEKYPVYKSAFSNLLSDLNYIVKFKTDKDGDLLQMEVGYKEDLWIIDNIS